MNLFRLSLFLLLIIPGSVMAQGVDMADEMRASGKIYVVVAVMSLVFVGVALYLLRLDRKLSKLEKELNEKP